MISNNLSKEEYRTFKAKYTEDADTLISANNRLRLEIEDALSCKHERMAWIEHFRNFADIDAIDRRTVVHLVQSIRVIGKTEIQIDFNYQVEYETALNLLEQGVAV
jgi:hypothetical protein